MCLQILITIVIYTHRSNQAVTAKAQGKRAKPSFQAGGWADKSPKQNGVKTGDREARGRQVRRMKLFNSCTSKKGAAIKSFNLNKGAAK